jgi:hypothetical protein
MKKMKKSLLSILLILSSFNFLIAQTSSEPATLFNGNKVSLTDVGFFLAPAVNVSSMDGDIANLFHLRGGINLVDKFTIGGFYNVSMNRIMPESETLPNIYMDYWSAGGFTEYTLFSKKLVHLSLPLYVGYGEVQMDSENSDPELGESNFVKIEPSALLELNLHKYVRFNAGIGYRIVSEMNYRNINQSDISGITTYFGLKIGLFR